METSKFRVGDVVKLKSGGPAMTVIAYDPDRDGEYKCPYTTCSWFSSDNCQEKGRFPVEAIDVVAPIKLQSWTSYSTPAPLVDGLGQRHSHDNGVTWKSGAYCYCYSYLYW